jgi:hypothetical protein
MKRLIVAAFGVAAPAADAAGALDAGKARRKCATSASGQPAL